MGELTESNPKCLVKIFDNTTILSKQIEDLLSYGIDNIVITTGYLDYTLKDYVKNTFPEVNLTFIHNEVYDKTNYIYSLYKTIDYTKDDIILMHGDLCFEREILRDLIGSRESYVVIDTTIPLPEKDFKARIENELITEISVKISGEDCYPCQPLYKLNKEDWLIWLAEISSFCEQGISNVYAEEAFNKISYQMKLYPYDVKGRLCMEIDNIEDLHKIQKQYKLGSEM